MSKRDDLRMVVFSDTQFHPWQESERPDRWHEMIAVIARVRGIAEQERADAVVFCGDLFESKAFLRSDVCAAALSAIREQLLFRFRTIWLAGNHDWYRGECILNALRRECDQATIVAPDSNPETCIVTQHLSAGGKDETSGWRLAFAPWGASPGLLAFLSRETYDVLFTHTEFRGGVFSPGIVSERSGLPDELLLRRQRGARAIIAGHYHRPQVIQSNAGAAPIGVVGAPYHINWTDADDLGARGCLLLTLTDHVSSAQSGYAVKRFSFDDAYPKFYRHTNAAWARSMDFVAPDLTARDAASAAQTVRHDGDDSGLIIGGDASESLAAYLSAKLPALKVARRARLLRQGKRLLTGGIADAEEEEEEESLIV